MTTSFPSEASIRLDHAKALSALSDLLGAKGWLTGADAQAYQRDWLDRYGVPALGVARPSSTAEVSEVLKICSGSKLVVVPQGGNTGLCGGAVAQSSGSVILSLARMGRIDEPDVDSGSVLVEAGAVLASLHERLEQYRLQLPIHLGAEGSARIGGLISTNAGGSHAFRYGMMQDLVLGLEVVLPDGSIWNGLRSVQKDNAGYQLRKLFCGAEGTLGVVTRAVLRLFPASVQRSAALLVMRDYDAMIAFGRHLRQEAGELTTALEFFSDLGLTLALKNLPELSFPLETRGEVYLLVELASSSTRLPLDEVLSAELEWGIEQGFVVDGALAMTDAQRQHFWRLREEQPEGQRLEGVQIKCDISVPPAAIPRFIDEASRICGEILPAVRPNPFGHLGDGNIHYNLSPPDTQSDFAGKSESLAGELAALAGAMGGSFAAEHGLGRAKIALADSIRSPVERALMVRVKGAFDPHGVMNPGVLVHTDPQSKSFD